MRPPVAPAPTPTPTPTPTPAPTPTPTPTSANFPQQAVPAAFNTREFRDSDGPGQHNAASVWADGNIGTGVTIAVIDTGIDNDSPEFTGRISPASIDIVANRALEGPDDHGTLVSLVAAAARDNTGVVGIAWDATVLAIRADAPGTCGSDNAQDPNSECAFFDNDIAAAIDYAVANGAKVINISLGGPGGNNARLNSSVRAAVDAGVLIVVAAGNDGLPGLEQSGVDFASAGDGGVLVVGSVDANYNISSFSNRAGTNTAQYLAARGETICCVYQDGAVFVDNEGFIFLFSGTSFASPQVAGAAALLAQAFPNLTGRQIAEILLESAFDAGAAGNDAVFGRGILDIAAAFQPIGTTSIAGQGTALALGDGSGVASPAMGDAFRKAALPTLITDRFARAFETDLAGTLRGAEQRQQLHGVIATQTRALSGDAAGASVAFTIDARGLQPPRAQALRLSHTDAEQARVLAARVSVQVAPTTQFAFAYRGGASGVVTGLQGQERPAFMIAGEASNNDGMLAGSDAAVALREQIGPWGLTVSAETGSTFTGATVRRAAALRGQRLDEDMASFGLALDRRLGALDTAFGVTWAAEDRTVLGARFHEGLGLAGSDNLFVDLDLGWRPASRWRLGASWRQGFTDLRDAPLVAGGSRMTSNGWSVDLERSGFLAGDDRIALRLSQPLRVTGGGLNLRLPSSYSYETLLPDAYAIQTLSLSPEGRELTGELAWRGRFWGGSAAASLFYRNQPGHYADAASDAGMALRWSRAF
ncbi:S8 family peptidase [Aurantiacibacter marinus]|nr:S8 family peptidase [Aurantiacibacter marinus]